MIVLSRDLPTQITLISDKETLSKLEKVILKGGLIVSKAETVQPAEKENEPSQQIRSTDRSHGPC